MRFVRWAEVVVLSASVPALGLLLDPQNPFFLDAGFPLPAIASALIGLRYGVAYAVPSAFGIVSAAALASSWSSLPLQSVPIGLTVAAILSAVICGHFRDAWERDRARYEIERAYQSARIEQIGHSYGILLESHRKLEERLSGDAVSLRAALTASRERLMVSSLTAPDVAHRFAAAILDLFAEYGQVQTAAVYRCGTADDSKQPGSPAPQRLECLATRGKPAGLSTTNPLLLEALQSDSTVVAAAHQLVATQGFEAITPIRCGDGRIWGVVCVAEMGALDHLHRTVGLLSLIADYVSDGLSAQLASESETVEGIGGIRGIIDRWCQNAARHGLPGTLLVLQSDNRLRLRAIGEVLRARARMLDDVWLWDGKSGSRFVLALLPLTGIASAGVLIRRVEAEILERGGLPFEQAGVRVDTIALTGKDAAEAILRRLDAASRQADVHLTALSVAPQTEN